MPNTSEARRAVPATSPGLPLARFGFIGGDPCVDFVNTIVGWPARADTERLRSYGDLIDWTEQAGLLDHATGVTLRQAAASREDDAWRVLRRARTFRDHLRRTLIHVASDASPNEDAIDGITAEARRAAARSKLVHLGERFAWVLDEAKGGELDRPVWELARSAVAFLTSNSMRQVRQCADVSCGWLFVDKSRNHSRRWCDMSTCGNRAKARRNYARQKARRLTAE